MNTKRGRVGLDGVGVDPLYSLRCVSQQVWEGIQKEMEGENSKNPRKKGVERRELKVKSLRVQGWEFGPLLLICVVFIGLENPRNMKLSLEIF